MSFLKSVDQTTLAKATALAVISIPVAMIYLFYKVNQAPKERPVSLEEAYPNEHLGIG